MLLKLMDNRFLGPLLLFVVLAFFIAEMLGFGFRQALFMPGKTLSSHHQIETDCDACHTPLGGVKKEACLDCHKAELDAVEDSHAAKVFKDPRAYQWLEIIDAKQCVTCHEEHIADRTGDKVGALPDDFCYPCHEDVSEERESHKDFAEDGCSASGCHNYHDNRALYEAFIAKHLDEAEVLPSVQVPVRNIAQVRAQQANQPVLSLSASEQDALNDSASSEIIQHWAASAHAQNGVNCTACHMQTVADKTEQQWTDFPEMGVCKECHDLEMEGFLQGKHGARLASGLSPMTPASARLAMKDKAADKPLNCDSCHQPHQRDIQQAAVLACLGCHDDEHSKAYINSPHHELWKQEIDGLLPAGSGVSCATCHLPRMEHKKTGIDRILVVHNQNQNLHPNSKMIRGVCMHCHGYGFSLNALADQGLLLNNYSSSPAKEIESLDMVRTRKENKARKKRLKQESEQQ